MFPFNPNILVATACVEMSLYLVWRVIHYPGEF